MENKEIIEREIKRQNSILYLAIMSNISLILGSKIVKIKREKDLANGRYLKVRDDIEGCLAVTDYYNEIYGTEIFAR